MEWRRMKKILVRAPVWLGDAVVSTVFIQRLKKKFPEASISVISTPALSPLFASHPDVSSVFPFAKNKEAGVFARRVELRAQSFDAHYVLPRSLRTALEAAVVGAPERIGFGGDLRRLFLTRSAPYDVSLAYPRRYLKLIGEEDITVGEMAPFFPVSQSPVELAGPRYPGPYLAVAPVSVAPARTWLPERFSAVARRFVESSGGTAVVLGSPSEKKITARIARDIGERGLDLGGRLDLPALGAVVKASRYFLGNDSGLMHVAAVFGVPSVLIFGASDPAMAVPLWGKTVVLQNKNVPCVPCLRNECVRFGAGYKECLYTIQEGQAFQAINELK